MKIAEALDTLAAIPGAYCDYCLSPQEHRNAEVIEFKSDNPDHVVEICVACLEKLLGEAKGGEDE